MEQPGELLPQPRTILEYATTGQQFPVTSSLMVRGEPAVAIGYDNGNHHGKVAIIAPHGALTTLCIPAAYRPAQMLRAADRLIVTYQVDNGTPFWVGASAIEQGQSLRVGPTPERISDIRSQEFIVANLVEALQQALYPPGDYTLVLGFGIPNDEIVRMGNGAQEQLGVAPLPRAALQSTLNRKSVTVTRTDEEGVTTAWRLTLAYMIPQAQSLGTYLAWSHTPRGVNVSDLEAVTIVDAGGGDTQRIMLSTHPYRMTTTYLGPGTIELARELQQAFPRLNAARAQHALMTRAVTLGGRSTDIGSTVDALISRTGQDIISRMHPAFQDVERFLLVTGGGTIPLRQAIQASIEAVEKRPGVPRTHGEDFAIIEPAIAVTLNAIGQLFSAIFWAASHGA